MIYRFSVFCIGLGMQVAYWGGVQARKRGWVE